MSAVSFDGVVTLTEQGRVKAASLVVQAMHADDFHASKASMR